MRDGTYTGVVDRIEDGETAVILLEDDEEVVEQLDRPAEKIPEDGRHEGAVFEVTVTDGEVVDIDYRPQAECERREAAQDRFDRLSRRLDEE